MWKDNWIKSDQTDFTDISKMIQRHLAGEKTTKQKLFKQLEELIKNKVALLVANCSVICYVWQSEAGIVLFHILWMKKILAVYASPFSPWMFCNGLEIYFSIIFHLYTPSAHQMSRGKGKLDFFFLHFVCVVCYSEGYVWVSTYVNMYIGLLVLCKLCACLHKLFCMHCWVLL